MAKAPGLKFVAKGVNDLNYATKFYSDFFQFSKVKKSALKDEDFNFKNYYNLTEELFNEEGGAILQLVQEEDARIHKFEPDLSQIGILGVKIKTRKIDQNFFLRRSRTVKIQTNYTYHPLRRKHFHLVADNILFQIFDAEENFFADLNKHNCGVGGVIIGVSDIEKSGEFYSKILGYDKVIEQTEGVFSDFKDLKNGDKYFKRLILQQTENQDAEYRNFLGNSEVELIEIQGFADEYTPDFRNSGLNYLSINNNSVIGNLSNIGQEVIYKNDDKNLIYFKDPDGLKITVQKIEKKYIRAVTDFKILSKLIKK